MKRKSSRRTFLQAGLMLPAAELISSRSLERLSRRLAKLSIELWARQG